MAYDCNEWAGTYTNLDLVMNLISGFQTVEPRWNGLKLYLHMVDWVDHHGVEGEERWWWECCAICCSCWGGGGDGGGGEPTFKWGRLIFLFLLFFWCLNIFLPGGLPAWPAGGGVGRMQAGAGIQIQTYKSRYSHSKNTNTKIQNTNPTPRIPDSSTPSCFSSVTEKSPAFWF